MTEDAYLAGYRKLNDDELVEKGDVIECISDGAYYEVMTDTIHGLCIGCPASSVKKWDNIDEVYRKDANIV